MAYKRAPASRRVVRVAFATGALFAAASCGTDADADPVFESPPGVSVILGGASGPSNGSVWVDGERIDYGNSHLTGLFADDDNIYAAGRTGLLNRAVVWTNHDASRISGAGATITGMWVEDGEPYLVGTSGFTDRGTVWSVRRDTESRATLDEANANAWVVAVDSGDVYAAGTIGNAVENSGYWKNGVWRELEQSEAKLADLFVADGVTYIVGAYGLNGRAGLWIDDELDTVDDVAAELTHVFVEDGSVYLAGFSGPQSIAAYWVDRERIDIDDDNAIITDMFVHDGSVYLAGSYGLRGQPAFWVDGERTSIDDSNAEVHLIFVRDA